ncbi:MAG: ribose-5-phosphate isomerase RpiA [Cardiobacteriaceae bacterium]|nr:ribose-5-phosphate isomerase RpiA [Cardiobacteriaceae bacterium]
MDQKALKMLVAKEALHYIEDGIILGVGSGSTVNCFIDMLGTKKMSFIDIVTASEETSRQLQAYGYHVSNLNSVGHIDVYIDGCDEINPSKAMIKGGGAALTREKIVAACAKKFVCIVDESKHVPILGKFPLPVEVIPMARSYVARELVKIGGEPRWREGITTDNGNWILDVHHLSITEPFKLEEHINNIPGVVTNGIFARQSADIVITSYDNGNIKIS